MPKSLNRTFRIVAAAVATAGLLAVSLSGASQDILGCPAGDGHPAIAARDLPETLFTRPEASVPASKRTMRGLYLTARDAYEMVQEDPARVLFVDVRTRGELQFIGMPTPADAHVPFMIEAEPVQWDDAASSFKLVPNRKFVAGIDQRLTRKGLDKSAPIILICQGGLRAARAADALTQVGYQNVYTVVDGFEGDPVAEGPTRGQRLVNGWRNEGLPWSTHLQRDRMYGMD